MPLRVGGSRVGGSPRVWWGGELVGKRARESRKWPSHAKCLGSGPLTRDDQALGG
eukprot:CAMPEP_0185527346 /NCGR_PEP_ID=MMETSP1366-20130426/95790_1 /TAXON_ID=38817 /ORGANISM="Gephyrocapsa oceanica, Strain RCC1303" /LENGTH=54 /DNA_ID=CAMNT_0028138839 /DNA_START=75 /DNA_END=236 /DNA_ORIENTATION=-